MGGIWQKVEAENLVRHKSGNYYLQATVGGKKIRFSLKTTDLRIAKMKRDNHLAPRRAAAPGAADRIKSLGDALLLVEARELGKPHLKPRTREYYEALFKILKETLPLTRAGHSFSSDDARHWWKDTASKRSSTQSNNLLRLLKMACDAILKAGLRFDNPCADLTRMKLKKTAVEKLPSREDFEKIVDHIGSQKKSKSKAAALHVQFLAWSGCRVGEASQITWKDVGEDWLCVHGGEAGTKGGETRMIPINPRLRAILEALRTLTGGEGAVLPLKRPHEALKNACAHLKLTHMRIHDLRHLFATMAIEKGVDVPTLARWMGHKDGGILIMKTYGHLRDDHSLEAAKRMG